MESSVTVDPITLPGVGGVEELIDCPSYHQRIEEVGEVTHGFPIIALGLYL